MSESKLRKVVGEKKLTRVQAEKALSAGVDPQKFTAHPNYHVRRRAWQLMGRPLPESVDDQNKFLATLQGTEVPKDGEAAKGFYLLLRQRILKEVPVKEDVIVNDETLATST